ncbi:MAG: acetyltransferase [Halothiobacillaceae bacterium]|jgi:hypothetical protein|nr:acetyltransferase [Halothiobacillaceae bacterium]
MYMLHHDSGDLVEILDHEALADPLRGTVSGRFHAGEEMQEPTSFAKNGLRFPSGESLPRCWLEAEWRGR